MCLIRSAMKHEPFRAAEPAPGLSGIMRQVAAHSARPRYTFLVLDLIARAAGPGGRAGPLVREGTALVPIREWLCDAISPSAARHHRRVAIADQVRMELAAHSRLPSDPAEAQRAIDDELRDRVRASGMTSVSRAVSELVRAGLLKRHYQGYRVDHENRGAQRQAVYTVPPEIRNALDRSR